MEEGRTALWELPRDLILVHGEADGLSGIIIDKFADVLVVQPHSAGLLHVYAELFEALKQHYPDGTIVVRPDARSEKRENVSFAGLAASYPAPPRVTIREFSARMHVNFDVGHKTGYFLDQRDNRAAVAELAAGRDVADLYCYTGGFALHSALAGAKNVLAVDLDEKALDMARANAKLNKVKITFEQHDVFNFLRACKESGRQFDVVIADPAKLAGVKAELPRALRTYGDLNKLAMAIVRPGGILVSCSCSGLVSTEQFLRILSQSANDADVILQTFNVTSASPDHPVTNVFPEARYLKTVYSRVLTP